MKSSSPIISFSYTAYGLTIQTPFPCPVLMPASPQAAPDVIVSYGTVPFHLAAPLLQESNWEAAVGSFLLRAGPRAGRFLVQGESQVTVQRNPAAEDVMLAFYFLDSVLAALLRQRGMLVVHGNAAVLPAPRDAPAAASAVIVSGESGAGKSTTLAALLERGCAMLADDITALQLDPAGRVIALPGIPQLHLCEDAAQGLGQDISQAPRYPWRRMKAAIPAGDAMAQHPAQLRAIYLLQLQDQIGLDVPSLFELSGADKFAALQQCVYGPMLPQEHPGLFRTFSAITDQTAIYRILRPANRWTVDFLVDQILSTAS
ncbi:MAG: hypothetical protein JW726_15290 [Anaerolineales bacterium]|nr:hypothetical protein [Anaerolineales bacterium]